MDTPHVFTTCCTKSSPPAAILQKLVLGGAITLLVLASACSTTGTLDTQARKGGLSVGAVAAGEFTLATVAGPLPSRVHRLRVYLGSDGRPWRGKQPATDPTGSRHLAIELLQRDSGPALYLGRPCYHGGADAPPCTSALWTAGRYSATVVDAMAYALREIMQRHGVEQLTLVGYSGGGALALLIATRLDAPVAGLTVVTVAANLDIAAWTRHHAHLPLDASLNPLVEVPAPAAFRQVHLVGRVDRVVPPAAIKAYLRAHPDASVWYLDDFDHSCCWVEHWPALLRRLDPMPGRPAPAPALP